MPLKQPTTKPHSTSFLTAVSYRIPCPVTALLQFPDGNCYPICPRCLLTLDREYIQFCDRCGQHLSWHTFPVAQLQTFQLRKEKEE